MHSANAGQATVWPRRACLSAEASAQAEDITRVPYSTPACHSRHLFGGNAGRPLAIYVV